MVHTQAHWNIWEMCSHPFQIFSFPRKKAFRDLGPLFSNHFLVVWVPEEISLVGDDNQKILLEADPESGLILSLGLPVCTEKGSLIN